MISCVCNRGIEEVPIDLTKIDPQIIAVDPTVCEKAIKLKLSLTGPFKALCIHQDPNKESFAIPTVINHVSKVPDKTYLMIIQAENRFITLFCLSHHKVAVTLAAIDDDLILKIKAPCTEDQEGVRNVLICLQDKNINAAIKNILDYALALTGGTGKLLADKLPAPQWLDTLGWESGVALGQAVSHSKIVESAKSLVESGFPPGFVLIDEGWQQLEGETMAGFEADPLRFPRGLRGVVDDLRSLGIYHVGVWHGMMGYRGGISKQLADYYGIKEDQKGRYFLGSDMGQTFEFYYDFYGYLREQGIGFIKVGDQSSLIKFRCEERSTTELYKNLQSALQAAAGIQFNSAHFNTECLCNENLFYWGNSRIARVADDIDLNSNSGIKEAIWNNLANSLWMQHLMQPDFDGWLTYGDQAEVLAIFHALSGSINVIGDVAGEHNKHLIEKFLLPNGILLKADKPLTLCMDSVFCEPLQQKKITKAFTKKGAHGIVAAFNLSRESISLHGTVSSQDVEGLLGSSFALFSYQKGFIKLIDAEESVSITLKPDEGDVFTFAPLHQGIAVWGAYGYYLAPGPIVEVHIEEDAVHLSSCVGAAILLYCERKVLDVRCNSKAIPWEYDSKKLTLSIDSRRHVDRAHAQYTITFEA